MATAPATPPAESLSLERVREEIRKSEAEQQEGFQVELALKGVQVLRDARTYTNDRFERERRTGLLLTSLTEPKE